MGPCHDSRTGVGNARTSGFGDDRGVFARSNGSKPGVKLRGIGFVPDLGN